MSGLLKDLEKEYRKYKAKKEKYEAIKNRLSEAYDELARIKEQHKEYRKRVENHIMSDTSEWSGSNYNLYLQQGSDILSDLMKVNDDIDSLMDHINSARSAAISEYKKFDGLCSKLWDGIQNRFN